MMAFAPRALDGKTKAQHDMRIAAKRLRYVLEVTGFVFGKPADTARRRARDLQDILGEIHDCDVMLPRVRRAPRAAAAASDAASGQGERRAGSRSRSEAGRAGAASNRLPRARRAGGLSRGPPRAAEDRFADFWRRQEQTGTWVRLERAVDGHLRRARDARRAAKAAERARQRAEAAERAARQAAEAQAEQARRDREQASRSAVDFRGS